MRLVALLISSMFLTSCFQKAVPTRGLVAQYSFEDGKGKDLSANNNDGEVNRANETRDRFGRKDHALEFNSERDYVEVENPSFLRSRQGTVVAWVKFDELDKVQYVASVGDANSIESYLGFIRLDPSTKTLGIYERNDNNVNWMQGATIISPDVYYCVILISDGKKWSMFINGTREAITEKNGKNTGEWVGDLAGIDNFVIGNSRLKNPYDVPNLTGVIDAVLVYDRPLKKREVDVLNRLGNKKQTP
jgi:hypothetical protein